MGAMDIAGFHAGRRFVEVASGRIAYVERGQGAPALFVHGVPINGYHWRHVIDRLQHRRRCIAIDLMGPTAGCSSRRIAPKRWSHRCSNSGANTAARARSGGRVTLDERPCQHPARARRVMARRFPGCARAPS
jgi:hypothetical protein